mmetsp:Transcript_130263/g.405193  ORF Transcript_130263/g.405193 Transcript_130263/m.405193 type:complete len:100 (-) Transcript_130263:45-344(-)
MLPLCAAKWGNTKTMCRDSKRYVGWGYSMQETMAVGSLGFGMDKSSEPPADAQKKEVILAERKALAMSLGVPLASVKVTTFQVDTSPAAATSVAAMTNF